VPDSKSTPPVHLQYFYRGLAQPYSSTARDAPPVGSFTGGLRRTLPDMFIGYSEIVAFLFISFPRSGASHPQNLLIPWCIAAHP
jgi:hypothetical protein